MTHRPANPKSTKQADSPEHLDLPITSYNVVTHMGAGNPTDATGSGHLSRYASTLSRDQRVGWDSFHDPSPA